ncbi:MAG: exodeoxyribonuclease VII large subunit [Bacteroidales bacterium]|nr:exodeoxyribonuclease VII large subunit [Bacteroidales bacterium]
MERKAVSLFELTEKIRLVIEKELITTYWVVGEISELRVNSNGHCYLELIEKENDKIIARIRATIWSYSFRMIKPFFETSTGQALSEGIKVMVNVSVEYHELFGLSLNIKDIDPTYTLGEMARRRQEIIRQLEEDGIIDMNKSLNFPILPRKIAIISSETAAGFEDFVNQLENNSYGYKFYYKLFKASMQGEKTSDSIISALDKIYKCNDFFDLVVIIRGGGSKAELSSFDNYWLAFNIAQFPLPVLTGIGHERDQSIADIVAFESLKTPTAVAEYIIEKMEQAENEIDILHNEFKDVIANLLEEKYDYLNNLSTQFVPFVKKKLSQNYVSLNFKVNKLKFASQTVIESNFGNLDFFRQRAVSSAKNCLEKKNSSLNNSGNGFRASLVGFFRQQKSELDKATYFADLSNPIKILEKGYSITLRNGKPLRSKAEVEVGDLLQTRVKDGLVFSKTIEKND